MTEDETVAEYDVRSPASRTLLTVVGTIVTVAVVAGVVLGISVLKRSTETSTRVVDFAGRTQIAIDAGSADLRIVRGDSDGVKVTTRVTSGIRATDFELARRGDEIKIVASCQTWLSPGCGAVVTLALPPGFPVVIRTTSGNVDARSIDEDVLTVATGSGDISARALRVDEFSARSSSGDIFAVFADQPFALKATTGSGDIRATIPDGSRTYAVMAKSKSGDVKSSIDSNADGGGFIRVASGSGNISLSR